MLNAIEITSVKIQPNGWLLNGNMLVPDAVGNVEREAILKWIAKGNTPEPQFTDEELVANQKAKVISDARALLASTDWILSKYTDLVVVQKLITEEDFNTKYADVLKQRNDARGALK
jgi:hypothetical protein